MLLAGLLALLAACVATHDVPYSTAMARDLILYDAQGQVVLCADFHWPDDPLTPGRNFAGQWSAAWMSRSLRGLVTFGPDRTASYHAEMAAENMSVDLSLGQVDNNLFLVGTQTGGVFTGQWFQSGLTGNKPMGKFTLRYETAPASRPTSSP
jgi:hypothetical protein